MNQAAPPRPGPPSNAREEGRKRLDAACQIRLDRIVPDPGQPRTEFDPEALARLAESLKQRGQLQPIRVRWDDATDRYVVVVGERRYRAARLAGLETIACVVTTEAASPEDLLEDQLVENALREDLKPIEQARAYRSLLTARGLTQRQLAERLQIGHASIARALALLELPEPIQEDVEAGKIAPNTAYELSKVDDPGEQATLAREAAGGRLRRDELKELTGAPKKGRGVGKPPEAEGVPDPGRARHRRAEVGRRRVHPLGPGRCPGTARRRHRRGMSRGLDRRPTDRPDILVDLPQSGPFHSSHRTP